MCWVCFLQARLSNFYFLWCDNCVHNRLRQRLLEIVERVEYKWFYWFLCVWNAYKKYMNFLKCDVNEPTEYVKVPFAVLFLSRTFIFAQKVSILNSQETNRNWIVYNIQWFVADSVSNRYCAYMRVCKCVMERFIIKFIQTIMVTIYKSTNAYSLALHFGTLCVCVCLSTCAITHSITWYVIVACGVNEPCARNLIICRYLRY